MPITRLLQGIVTPEELERAKALYDEACHDYEVAADNESVRLAFAEVIMAATSGAFSTERLARLLDATARGLGLRRRSES
jgi:hypothetical protein